MDDGTDPVRDLMPDDSRIRYLYQEHRLTVGAKRNLACREARGEFIAHWDDDDWMAAWRLRYQVTELLQTQASLCGLSRLLFDQPETNQAWEYVYPAGQKPWVAGGTLCYTKAWWQEHPFPDLNVGEDNHFIWSLPADQIIALQDNTFYVALIHPGNTSPKRTQSRRWHAYSPARLHSLMGKDTSSSTSDLQGAAGSQAPASAADGFPLVSCIMATYNHAHFLPQAIQYFLRQDYPNKELIIVDDGPSPDLVDIPQDKRIRHVKLDVWTPLGRKLNLGIEASRGQIIQKLDDDDYYHPHFLTTTITALTGWDPQPGVGT
ncbi:MAG: hypothetical protein ETSY1_44980, partial [Candidatus Entotheonella factor]